MSLSLYLHTRCYLTSPKYELRQYRDRESRLEGWRCHLDIHLHRPDRNSLAFEPAGAFSITIVGSITFFDPGKVSLELLLIVITCESLEFQLTI